MAYDAEKAAHPGVGPWTPTPAELAAAGRAPAAVPGDQELLYARGDLVPGDDGEPRITERGPVESNLFLDLHPDSVPPVAEAILTAAG